MDKKTYEIGGRKYSIPKITMEQYELISDAAEKEKININISFNQEDAAVTQQLMDVIDALIKTKQIRPVLSYLLVEEGRKFNVDDTAANQEVFKKINDETMVEVLLSFFVGKVTVFTRCLPKVSAS